MIRHMTGFVFVALAILLQSVGCAPKPPCELHPGELSLVTQEIDTAAKLTFDDAKAEALTNVARRPDITPAEQEYLVCVTVHAMTFDHGRLDVFRTLIHNPSFSPRGKSAVLRHVKAFAFDDTRASVLRDLQGRGDVQPELKKQADPM